MISLTSSASTKIVELKSLREDKEEVKGLRVGVRGGGCSGFSYFLKFDNNLKKFI